MEVTAKGQEILRYVIKINNDRIRSFEQAQAALPGQGDVVGSVLKKLAGDSRNYVIQLSGLALEEGMDAETVTGNSGSPHPDRPDWGNEPEAVLAECYRRERAIEDAYAEALARPNELSPELYNLLTYQQESIREGHDRLLPLLEGERTGALNALGDPAAEKMEQENTPELQPGYEKQNIPGMEPPEHFAASPAAGAGTPVSSDWNRDEKPESFKDIEIDFRKERQQQEPTGDL